MTGLIVKSPYYKCDGKSSVSGYMSYIATRERVELIPDDRPPTRKQSKLAEMIEEVKTEIAQEKERLKQIKKAS